MTSGRPHASVARRIDTAHLWPAQGLFNPAEYFDDIEDEKVPKDMLDLALHIVESKRGEFEPQKFEDHYENALKELLRKKQHGERIERPKESARRNVVNLMDALRASVDSEKKKATAPSVQARRPAKTKFATTIRRKLSLLNHLRRNSLAKKCPCHWLGRCSQITQFVIRFEA